MMNVPRYIATAAVVFLAIFGSSSEAGTVKQSDSAQPKVVLLSIGGLGGHYFARMNLTNIDEMIANGTMAKYVENSVNVIDIVDHYSMATGLYPESHGIVSNTMFDPKLNRVFNSETRGQSEWWVDVHPIWQEIEKQGQGLSALCRWPGVYGPMVSTLHCGQRRSLRDDIDQAIKWLKNDVKLVLLYSDDIKKAAIRWGPHSQQAIDQVKKLDSTLKYLLNKTRDLDVNILLTSDSGVTDLHWDNVIDLDQCIDPHSYVLIQPQATLLIYPKHGHTVQELYLNLTKCRHVKAYLKQNLPKRLHFSNNRRIPPIIVFVPLGAVVRSGKRLHQRINELVLNGTPGDRMGGTGYHPGYEEMRGVFIGYGPSFQPGLKFQAIKNVDIYGLVCHLLGITPRPNNGSRDVVTSMFRDMTSFAVDVNTTVAPQPITDRTRIDTNVRVLFWILVVTTALLMLFCCVGCVVTMRQNSKQDHATKTHVHDEKRLLSAESSDEEDE